MIDDIQINKIATDVLNRVTNGAGYVKKEQRTIEFAQAGHAIRWAQEYCMANRLDKKVLDKIKKVIVDTPIVFPQVNPPEK